MTGSAALFDSPVTPPPEGEPWTVLRLIRWSTAYLRKRGVPDARLDAEHLLASALQLDRLALYLRFEQPVSSDELARFRPKLLERARRRPLQYILGRCPFREIELAVDERVLIPRPETEELVGLVLDRCPTGGGRVLDVGTGSGAVALSLAREGAFDAIVATDVSDDAVAVATANADALGFRGRVDIRVGSTYDPLGPNERFRAVVSNPPYVSEADFDGLETEVRDWEPTVALRGGPDGLAVIRPLIAGATARLEPDGLLALEVGEGQAERVADMVSVTEGLTAPEILRDVRRVRRYVVARRHR